MKTLKTIIAFTLLTTITCTANAAVKVGSFVGTWKASITYAAGDLITYSNKTFLSLVAKNKNKNPDSNTKAWQVMGSVGGATGPRGPAGATGLTGPVGNTGLSGAIGLTGPAGAGVVLRDCVQSDLTGPWIFVVNKSNSAGVSVCFADFNGSGNASSAQCTDIHSGFSANGTGNGTIKPDCLVTFNFNTNAGESIYAEAMLSRGKDTFIGYYNNNFGDYGTFNAARK
jgi:hypothetical protein